MQPWRVRKEGDLRDLSQAKSGVEQVIDDMKGGPSHIIERLIELGFTIGEKILPRGQAPFGGPLIVQVRGTAVALRLDEARCVRLR